MYHRKYLKEISFVQNNTFCIIPFFSLRRLLRCVIFSPQATAVIFIHQVYIFKAVFLGLKNCQEKKKHLSWLTFKDILLFYKYV